MAYEAESDEMNDERFILKNWDILSSDTRRMLELVGISPQNGEEAN